LNAKAKSIAAQFVEARLAALPLAAFPGALPATMAAAYEIQEEAIRLWQAAPAGWKIGLVAPEHRARTGELRIAGPIFPDSIRFAVGERAVPAPVFDGGFAAVEAEIVLRVAHDAPPDRTRWTEADAAALIGAVHVGVEIASSPLAAINDLGPAVTAADFGNNAGLVVGPALLRVGDRPWADLRAEMFIDGRSVGAGSPDSVPGGPLAALVFILEHCARRDRPLREGDFVSTGAMTGVHRIRIGETARALFGDLGAVLCCAERAVPLRRGSKAAGG
jgi:2-keto-4-pentenoate hydratase